MVSIRSIYGGALVDVTGTQFLEFLAFLVLAFDKGQSPRSLDEKSSVQTYKRQPLGSGEARELYVFLLARTMCAPAPDLATVQPESISPRDPKPDPDARIHWHQEIFLKRAARFREKFVID